MPTPRRPPDVVVRMQEGMVVFDPKTLRAQAWLARNLPEANRDFLGYYFVSALWGARHALCMAMDGLEVR